jgi:long-chain fatty acid transport protein
MRTVKNSFGSVFRFTMGALLLLLVTVSQGAAQGVILPAAGALNRTMAGASTAVALDAMGATYWNPATIMGLESSEVGFGAELVSADLEVSSRIGAGAIGGVFPTTDRAGTTESDGGVAVIPTIALVRKNEGSSVATGVGIYALMGGSVNFPGSDSNPLLTPQNPPPQLGGTGDPPFTLGFGPQTNTTAILGIAPSIAMRVSDGVSIGGGPIISTGSLSLDPAFFAPRNENGTFPAATHTKPVWGGGFQVGATFDVNPRWTLGAAYRSQVWYSTFEYNSADETGRALDLELDLTLPRIISIGAAYKGERATVAADVRYLDYEGAELFGDSVRDGGLAWESIWAVAVGASFPFNEMVSGQLGYLYNENPIPAALTLFNVQIPAINQNQFSGGLTARMSEVVSVDLGLTYFFEDELSGQVLQIPDTEIELVQSIFSLAFGTRVAF